MSSAASSAKIGGSVTVWAEWTSTEQQDFLAAVTPFENETGITVNYTGKGSNMDTALNSASAAGRRPGPGPR
jgi:ABC-type glycerol-3-phosphate transport system substrate-binding protein